MRPFFYLAQFGFQPFNGRILRPKKSYTFRSNAMKMKKFLGTLAAFPVLSLCALLFAGCATGAASSAKDSDRPKVSSYIRTWPSNPEAREGNSVYWNAGQIKGDYLTDLIIAFALIDKDDGTTIYIPELRDAGTDPLFSNIWDEVAAVKKKFPHLKVNVSVGGYTGSWNFSDLAADPAKRAVFTQNVIKWLKDYDLDGVDIDWEYPVGPEWGLEIKTRPEDRTNYISLLKELRDALTALGTETGKYYSLSTCVPASKWFVTANDIESAAKLVDGFKLMAYDYYGSWSTTTGHNANLTTNPDDPAWGGWSTKDAVNAYLDAWVPASKIMLGFAFYGKIWSGVKDGGTHGLFQPYTGLPYDQGNITWLQIKELLKPDSGYTRYWDEVAESPYLYNGDNFISYTDEEAIKRISAYAKEKGLGGVFVWEYVQDVHGELLKVLAESRK
jgi:chitinase